MRRTLLALSMLPMPAWAAVLDGAGLSMLWNIPFVGILLSIAILPLVARRLWHDHHGAIAAFWGVTLLLPLALVFGGAAAGQVLLHVAMQEYLPFTLLLLALYTTGGGILIRGHLVGTPATNTALLAIGTALASVMGTTGACVLLIRLVLRANADRRRRTHIFVFFIFLVANIGGALTPLGDPPLYLGFLRGVSFFWPTTHLFGPFLLCAVVLLAAFWLLDRWHWAREAHPLPPTPDEKPSIEGWVNVALLLAIIAVVLVQGVWRPGDVTLLGEPVAIERLAGMAGFVAITLASLALTRTALRRENHFRWMPIAEVAKLFGAIFLCMAPALAMLQAGATGPFAPLLAMTSDAAGQPVPWVYFWLTGLLSSVLDNAPTYLIFFNLAGGDAAWLMTTGAPVLAAISAGAVFMGAVTYLGNAPNFLVLAIVEDEGVPMPSFFGYLGWACVWLMPLFVLLTFVFFL